MSVSATEQGLFPHTRWSLVVRAGDICSDGGKALGELLQAYWRPLYVFARQMGQRREEAEDLVQGFCLQLIQRGSFAAADPQLGRLRSYLLSGLKRYMTDQWRHQQRDKRGGGVVISFSQVDLEALEATASQESTPDAVFDQKWAQTLLERALVKLRKEYADRGREEVLTALEPLLSWGGAESGLLAEQLGLSRAALDQQVARMRRRFRALLEAEIVATTVDAADAQAEREYLLQVLAGRKTP